MAFIRTRIFMQLIMSSVIVVAIEAASHRADLSQTFTECPKQCGDLAISFPFGIGERCSLRPEFSITCNNSAKPPTAQFGNGNFIATDILVPDGELRILEDIAYVCNRTINKEYSSLNLSLPFTISGTKNKFTGIGCSNTIALYLGSLTNRLEEEYNTGCISSCNKLLSDPTNPSCSGSFGCCQATLPSGLNYQVFEVGPESNNLTEADLLESNNNTCSYAFVVEQGKFTFSTLKKALQNLSPTKRLPMILNWEIQQEGGCAVAKKRSDYACKENSTCLNRKSDFQTEPTGYYCQCSKGFEGNPYLPPGCRDRDECMAPIKPCNNGTCVNSIGDFNCLCHKGFQNKGSKTCTKIDPLLKTKDATIWLGVTLGFLGLVVAIAGIHWGMNKRRFTKLKEKNFKENGGITFQQQLASHGGRVDTAQIFTAQELEKATNNYDQSRVLGQGGYGIVYKGTLPDNTMVAIKKAKAVDRTKNDQFINEVTFLSQINHRNIVKLLGCCFETEVPLLVYEYIRNGTLYEHLFSDDSRRASLPWALRLKIASEAAGALAYLHSSASTPIIHRDVKAMNILLDEHYTAKVSDFGASRFIPLDQTEVSTLVQGTLGYLDPEYLQSHTLTEKSDVYSFGVVLAELLTSTKAISFGRPEEERSLASVFVSSVEKQSLVRILDADMVNEGNVKTVEQMADLAKRCLSLKGEERPMMKEVAAELEAIMRNITAKHSWETAGLEETEYLLEPPLASRVRIGDVGGEGHAVPSCISTSRYESMQIHMLESYGEGR